MSCAPHIRLNTIKTPRYRLRKSSISPSALLLSCSFMRSICSFSFLSAAACISFSLFLMFFSRSDTAVSRLPTLSSLSQSRTFSFFSSCCRFSFSFLCDSALFIKSSAFFFSSEAFFSCKSLSLLVTFCSVSCCTCCRSS